MEFYIPSKSNLTVKYEQRSLAGYNPWGRKELDMTQHKHNSAFRETKQCILTLKIFPVRMFKLKIRCFKHQILSSLKNLTLWRSLFPERLMFYCMGRSQHIENSNPHYLKSHSYFISSKLFQQFINNTLCILFSYKILTCSLPEMYLNCGSILFLHLSFAIYYIQFARS